MVSGLDLTLANDLTEIPRLASAVESYCAASGIGDDVAFKVNLALDELITNVVSYGFDADGHHRIQVRLSLREGTLTTELVDDGHPFDPLAHAEPPHLLAGIDDRPIGGLGIHFVRSLMDEVTYFRAGGHNHLVMRKRLAAPGA